MKERLKVLLLAYSCRPGFGSESGIGWHLALQAAKRHDVTVLARTGNQPWIEAGSKLLPPELPVPQFVFFELGRLELLATRLFPSSSWARYYWWQWRARREVARVQAVKQFDVLHHATWASFRAPTALWGHGAPVVWGPLGGAEQLPLPLFPWSYPGQFLFESLRWASNSIARFRLPQRAARSAVILVATAETQQVFAQAGFATTLMPMVGVFNAKSAARPLNDGPLRLVFAGRLVYYKGLQLALRALRASASNATLTVFGDGPLRSSLQRLARRLGLDAVVRFRGWVDREELLQRYAEFQVFILPSLHDSGPQALVEAMACGLPAICLDCGGPRQAVTPECGFKIPVASADAMIQGLATAISFYDEHRTQLRAHGIAASERMAGEYHWDKLGDIVDAAYLQAVQRFQPRTGNRVC